jgi:flagellar basal-body rod modification protein FlgD
MNTIQQQSTSDISLLPSSSSAKSSGTSSAELENNFLKMLVTQMRYQDPTNPVSSSEMTSQLAQISTVDGVNKLNNTVTSLLESMQASQLGQNANLIGHTVGMPSDTFDLSNGKAKFGVELTKAVDSLNVSITTASGQLLKTLNLGAQPAGAVPVSWNGQSDAGNKLPDGNYRMKINAFAAGQPVEATGLQFATVSSVSNGTSGPMLNLSNSRSVNSSSVAQIL